jgi:hypothetical protein
VLVIEDFGPDGNPHYHLPSDVVDHFDVPYYEKIAKLAIAGAATLAVPLDPAQGIGASGPEASFRLSAYPNPTDADCMFWVESATSEPVRIVVHDALGKVVAVMHEGLLAAGKQAFSLSLSAMAPGTYAIVAERAGRVPAVVRVVRTP